MRHPRSNQSNEYHPAGRRNTSVATTTDLLWTQPGLAMPEHEEHLRDEWSLHSKERDSHEGPDIRRQSDLGSAALQTRCAVHFGHPRFEIAEQLRTESGAVPVLGHPGGRQLPGVAERRRHCFGRARYFMGPRRWNRQHSRATCAQMSAQGRWSKR